jgi:hypothetical protein
MTNPLILTVAPRGPKGVFIGRIDGTALCIRATRNPMLATARALLQIGIDPKTVLILRNFGSAVDRVSGPLDVLVKKMGKKRGDSRLRQLDDGEVDLDGRRKARLMRNSEEDVTCDR